MNTSSSDFVCVPLSDTHAPPDGVTRRWFERVMLVKRLRRLLQKVIGVFRQWRHRRRKRRDDKQERKVAARENMRWPTRNDVPTDGPNIGL